MKLTNTENKYLGILVSNFNRELAAFYRDLEERLELEEGAIGTRYRLEAEKGELVEMEQVLSPNGSEVSE